MDSPEEHGHASRRELLKAASAGGFVTAFAGCLGVLGRGDADVIGDGPAIGLELVADGFTYPTDLKEVPDGSGRLFLTDQVGIVYGIDPATGDVWEFLDISERVEVPVGDFSEMGLLGIEFHPDFEDNGRFFLRYSWQDPAALPEGANHVEVLAEFNATGDTADETSETTILEIPQPLQIHQSGDVLFGPDGYLYLTTGDGGGILPDTDPSWYDRNAATAIRGTGQNTQDNLLGGVLRIDVDDTGNDPYAIPADNPLVEREDHRDEYYAWGFRNPWGAAFDGDDLYVADVGQALFEIVNLVEKGGNYGWNIREGTHCFDWERTRDPPDDCPSETPSDVRGGEPLLDPVIEYPQFAPASGLFAFNPFDTDIQFGSAIIGGGIYRGSVEALEGTYVCGDWSADPHGDPRGQLFRARPQTEVDDVHAYYEQRDLWPIDQLQVNTDDDVAEDGQLQRYVASMAIDLEGEMYALLTGTNLIAGDTGEVRKIVPA